MPFGTDTTSFGDGRRERLDPGFVAEINAWRQRFGIPTVTTRGVHDPVGAVREAERSARLGDAATATRNVALAIKVVGAITGNQIVKHVGKAVAEGAKVIAQQAAELLAGLPEAVENAMLEEFRHAMIAHHHIRTTRDLAVLWASANLVHFNDAIRIYNGGLGVTGERLRAKLRFGWQDRKSELEIERAAQHAEAGNAPVPAPPRAAHLAVFLPIYRHPAIRHFVAGAANRSRLDTLVGFIRDIPNMAVIAQQVRPPLDAATQAALDAQLRPMEWRNRLHRAAVPFLERREPWFGQRQALQAVALDRDFAAAQQRAAAAKAEQEIPQGGRQAAENQGAVTAAFSALNARAERLGLN